MFDLIKNQWIGIVAVLLVVVLFLLPTETSNVSTEESDGASEVTTITNPHTFEENVIFSTANFTSTGGNTTLGTTTVESFTQGGDLCTLTDANGGATVLTEAQLLRCSGFEFTASGAGQAAITVEFTPTSTLTSLIPNAGDCKSYWFSADALAAGTTTTMTATSGVHVIGYTTNDDVIDGDEFAVWGLCRRTDRDINWISSELLHAD